MKKFSVLFFVLSGFLFSCSKEKMDLVDPIATADFPFQIVMDEEEIFEPEDGDKVEFEITLTDRIDASGENPSGVTEPLAQDVRVMFALSDNEGFSDWNEYIVSGKAYYEVDDCNTSEDLGVDLQFQFDTLSGEGSFIFPAGVEGVIIEFELDPSITDDNVINPDARGFRFALTGLQNAPANVVVNTTLVSEFVAFDDEQVFGEWTLDHNDAVQLQGMIDLFQLAEEDVVGLVAADIDEVVMEITPTEVELKITLVATETIQGCSGLEVVNEEIEIEAEVDEVTDDDVDGDLVFIVELEDDNGYITEVEFSGTFSRSGNTLTLMLTGASGDTETNEITLTLTR
jgi:hypothetical protein